MVLFIIVLFVLLQKLAQHHRACNEQKVSCNDDHDNRYKKEHHRTQRALDGDSHVVSARKKQRTDQCDEQVALGRFLSQILTL